MHAHAVKNKTCSLCVFNILIALLLVACASPPPADVSDRRQPPTRKIHTHAVEPGESLYSIAWRYGLDFRALANHNGIGAPYTIYTSQSLRLDVGNPATRVRSVEPAVPATIARSPQVEHPPSTPSRKDTSPKRSENQTPPPKKETPPPLISGPVEWRWPASGPVIAGFTSNKGLNKGIDIGGKLGQPVIAAGGGQVVYAGTGLRGYGKLLIIKHNEAFLSAYAHNRALRVKEGDQVKAGQQIAELGSSGTDKEKLHFEIRRDGKPVDPLLYLPKR